MSIQIPGIFTREERADLHCRYEALEAFEARTKKEGTYPLFAEKIRKNRTDLLSDNPFPRFEPLPTLILADQLESFLQAEREKAGRLSFVAQKSDILFASCTLEDGNLREVISCGGYIFNNVMMAADYHSGIFDATNVGLYLAARARTRAIFNGEKQRPCHHGYYDFYYNVSMDGMKQIAAIDLAYADDALDYLPSGIVARTITAYSPLGVFSREYGARIVKTVRLADLIL